MEDSCEILDIETGEFCGKPAPHRVLLAKGRRRGYAFCCWHFDRWFSLKGHDHAVKGSDVTINLDGDWEGS